MKKKFFSVTEQGQKGGIFSWYILLHSTTLKAKFKGLLVFLDT